MKYLKRGLFLILALPLAAAWAASLSLVAVSKALVRRVDDLGLWLDVKLWR